MVEGEKVFPVRVLGAVFGDVEGGVVLINEESKIFSKDRGLFYCFAGTSI